MSHVKKLHLLACLQEMPSLLETLYLIYQMNQNSAAMNTASWDCYREDLETEVAQLFSIHSSFPDEPYNGQSPLSLSSRNMFAGLPSDAGETELLC